MTDLMSIMNPTGATQQVKTSDLYKVNYKDGQGGIYTSVVRFVPNVADPTKCILSKYVSWVKNPISQVGKYVDFATKENGGGTSPVSNLYFKIKNMNIASYTDFANAHLSTKTQYAALVQILDDKQHPELVGQIKVFTFGKTIYDKLNNEEHPVAGMGTNPFHPIYGRKFSIVCTNKSGFNNFDQSNFYDDKDPNTRDVMPSGMWYIDPATNQYAIATDQTDVNILVEYLKTNAPDLFRYDVQQWSEDQTAHVTETLAIIENMLQTGTLGTARQAAAQTAINTLSGAPTAPAAPQFPGATNQPQYAAPAAPAAPQFPGAAPAAPQFPGATPAAPTAPTAPHFPPVSPAMPMDNITGVDVPDVAPAVAQQPAPKKVVLNMDDVLSNM